MNDVIRLAPKPREPDQQEKVSAFTVETLRKLLDKAEAGEIVSVVAIAWRNGDAPSIHMSTEDRITALGAIRTMEHGLVRDWLDGAVVR